VKVVVTFRERDGARLKVSRVRVTSEGNRYMTSPVGSIPSPFLLFSLSFHFLSRVIVLEPMSFTSKIIYLLGLGLGLGSGLVRIRV
jgi:hypothetical protein